MAFVPSLSSLGSSFCLAESSVCKRERLFSRCVRNTCRSYDRISVGSTMRAGGGNGFGIKSKASDIAWAEQYKAYIRRSGEGVCRMAMDGFKKLGRGAVFVNYDPMPSERGGFGVVDGSGFRETEGLPAFYVSLGTLLEKNGDAAVLDPIVSRIRLYDPAKQFVVVFETGGVQGADIVTPKQMPTITPTEVLDLDDSDIRVVDQS